MERNSLRDERLKVKICSVSEVLPYISFLSFFSFLQNTAKALYFLNNNCTFLFVKSQLYNTKLLCTKLYLRRGFKGKRDQPSPLDGLVVTWAQQKHFSGQRICQKHNWPLESPFKFSKQCFQVFGFRFSNCFGDISITSRDGGYIGVSNADVGEFLHSLEGSVFDSCALQRVGAQFYKRSKCRALEDNFRILQVRTHSVFQQGI